MLSLPRRSGERLIVQLPDGRTMWLQVASVKGGEVRFWIDAPADVRIDREEIAYRRVHLSDLDIKGKE